MQKDKEKIKIIVVTGPTATGKTSLGVKLCHQFNGEVISIDSRQVYKGMDIGTGKDLDDYTVPYHLIDIVSPVDDEYNLMRFLQDSEECIKNVAASGKLPFMVGGTALYLNALLSGYELPGGAADKKGREELQQKSPEELGSILKELSEKEYDKIEDKCNPIRLVRAIEKLKYPTGYSSTLHEQLDALVLGVYYPRKTVHQRIEERLDARLQEGMIEEVEQLHENGVTWEKLDFFGLEYRYIALYLQGKMSRKEMREHLLIKIRQFAKRQDIWFRKMEREGKDIYWLPEADEKKAGGLIHLFLSNKALPEPALKISETFYGPKSS